MGWSRRRPAHGCSTGSSAAAFSPFCSFQISLLVSRPVLQMTPNANGQFCSYCNDILNTFFNRFASAIFVPFFLLYLCFYLMGSLYGLFRTYNLLPMHSYLAFPCQVWLAMIIMVTCIPHLSVCKDSRMFTRSFIRFT